MSIPEVLLWINGEARKASTGWTFEVYNPQTKKVVSIAHSASSEDCQDAVRAASEAQSAWEALPGHKKGQILFRAADLLESDKYLKDKINQTLKEETAATDGVCAMNLFGALALCRESAAQASQIKGEAFPSAASPGAQVIVQRRARGVILVMAPWNVPLTLAFRALAIPLICGNTIIFKGSELSPGSHSIVAELLHRAGLPPGVLNYITSERESSPQMVSELISNPLIRLISFTGSDRVGSLIAQEAAKCLKPCIFELGGKAPAVVLDDADVDSASRAIVYGAMMHSGQICMSTERVIAQRKVAKPLLEALKTLVSKLKAGPNASLSCLINEAAAETVVSMLKEAKAQGAEVVVGDLVHDGAIVQPHLLAGVKPGMRAWRRESFGPVIVFSEADTVEEAIALANSSSYSLTAAVWTSDLYKAHEVATKIHAGKVNINGPTLSVEPMLGLEGLGGSSGYGRFDVEHFTVKRLITVFPQYQPPLPLVG